MENKTKVRVKENVHQEQLSLGDVGYIDGYATLADGRHYAIVVIPNKYIGYAMVYQLTPIGNEK